MQPWVNVGRTFYISKSKWADSNLFAKHHQPLLNVSQWNVPRSLVTWQLSRKGGSVDAGMIAWWWQRWSIIRKHERWLFIDNMQPILQIQTICIITCVAPVVSTTPYMRICVIHRWRCQFYGTGCCCNAHPAWLALHHQLKAKTAQWPRVSRDQAPISSAQALVSHSNRWRFD